MTRGETQPRHEADPWTIGRILTWSVGWLRERGLVDSPRLDAELLLAEALGLTRMQLYMYFDKPLTAAEREPFRAALKRRAAGEPVAYIIGKKEFMGVSFAVTPAVLIPRPDTEVLVEAVLAWGKGKGLDKDEGWRILDVGTGSGCIAVALAKQQPGAVVTAWDIDEAALAVARGNAAEQAAAVTFARVDALSVEAWRSDDVPGDVFDVIVANPPYIATREEADLAPSVARYEPRLALFAAADGLAFYEVFAQRAAERLAPEGLLAVEIGHTQGPAVTALLAQAGWRHVRVLKDYERRDRVVLAERPAIEGCP